MKKRTIKITMKSKNLLNCRILEETMKLEKIFDASKRGLVAVSQQRQRDGERRHVGFASRYITDFELKFSIKELELLAIVWATGHFKNYVYGVLFKVASDH